MAAGMRRVLLAVGFALCGLGMTCIVPPDPDGTPLGARPLSLDEWVRDTIDCGRFSGDCADWYLVEVPGEGTLRLDLAKVQDEREVPDFTLALGDPAGRVIEDDQNAGRIRLRLDHAVRAGRYTVSVSTPAEGSGAMDYEVRASFRPKPHPKPAPRFSVVKATLLEVETRDDGGQAVLLDKGSRAGIAQGQRGRLLQGGDTIAEIEILDVYPDGSRALIRGSLKAAITPSTVAEVDVPL